MKLSDIATFVEDKISSNSISLADYVTTDSLFPNKEGKTFATNLPPVVCSLTHYREGDVLVANIRPYLKKVWLANKEGGASTDVLVFRVKKSNKSSFLYAVLLQDRFFEYAMKGAKGSKMPRGDKEQIMRYELPTFSPQEQENIGNIIISITKKMQLNRSLNHNLEAMAKQLYDYWFVQFDFPDENGKPYKSNGGEMIYSDALKKYIPKGWTHSPLRVLVDLEDFKRIPLSNAQRSERKGEFPYYGATGIMDYIDDFIFDYDILLLAEDRSTSDSNGFPVVQYVWGEVWVNNHAHIILPKDRAHLIYTYFLLKSIPVKMIETGSIQKKISQENLLRYKAINVPKQLRDIYTERIKSIWEQKKLATEEIIQLTKLRDSLLPLLMNGQASLNYDLSHD
ncbi:restriction endonuclease subunit S [Alloprevotella tannerae]|uniref:restriction endonuclease subunit S n=1 Tax=Alloprevotella tannerae TaxID=76122 RepID=UPI0028EC1AC3|nr:restriction endonuclease subunit S [Alloprevotella tannerae]